MDEETWSTLKDPRNEHFISRETAELCGFGHLDEVTLAGIRFKILDRDAIDKNAVNFNYVVCATVESLPNPEPPAAERIKCVCHLCRTEIWVHGKSAPVNVKKICMPCYNKMQHHESTQE